MYSCLINISVKKTSKNAFTLIELLAVTVVILILTGITFGISKGVLNQQARSQAKAELAIIAQALEAFKLTYGDYPVVSKDNPVTTNANAMELTKALTGYAYLEPGDVPGSRQMTDINNGEIRRDFLKADSLNFSRPFIDPNDVSETSIPDSASDFDHSSGRIYLVDPWRQPYVYVYDRGSSGGSSANWDNVGYVLFSKGPDRVADKINGTENKDIVEDGVIDQAHLSDVDNLDNIYPDQ